MAVHYETAKRSLVCCKVNTIWPTWYVDLSFFCSIWSIVYTKYEWSSFRNKIAWTRYHLLQHKWYAGRHLFSKHSLFLLLFLFYMIILLKIVDIKWPIIQYYKKLCESKWFQVHLKEKSLVFRYKLIGSTVFSLVFTVFSLESSKINNSFSWMNFVCKRNSFDVFYYVAHLPCFIHS